MSDEVAVPIEDWWYPGIPAMEEVEDLPLWLHWARLRQCDVLLQTGVSSPVIAWMDRALIEDFRGHPSGFAESCPTCWRQGTFAVEVKPKAPASPRLARAAVHDVYVSELTINNLERIGLLQGFAVTGEAGRPPRPRWHLTAAGDYEIAPYVEAGWPEGVEA
jgi:hypothetical protein